MTSKVVVSSQMKINRAENEQREGDIRHQGYSSTQEGSASSRVHRSARYAGIQRPKRWRKPQEVSNRVSASLQSSFERGAFVPGAFPGSFPEQGAKYSSQLQLQLQLHTSGSCELPERRVAVESVEQIQAGVSLDKSFSGLVVNSENANQPSSNRSRQHPRSSTLPPDSNLPAFVPHLTKPKKHREGYGFSYSETFMLDEDEYPDTEGDTEVDEDPSNPTLAHLPNQIEWRRQMIHATPPGSVGSYQASSFNDVVVLRDVGSFHIAKPQQKLPCTSATREDALRSKIKAKGLIKRYNESAEIQGHLLTRLESMVLVDQQRADDSGSHTSCTIRCAQKLRDFLNSVKEGRIDTGESQLLVEHELEWAAWLLDACITGVVHARVDGCECWPHWELEKD